VYLIAGLMPHFKTNNCAKIPLIDCREGRWNFKSVFVMNFALTLGFGVAETFFSIYMRSLGARGLTLGVALGFYAGAKILFGPFMGALADRVGKKTVICCSLLLLSSTSLAYLFATDMYFVILLRMLQGLGFAMYRPVVLSMIGELTPEAQRGSRFGTFDISFYAAIGTAPLLAGVIKDLWGFDGIFAILAALSITACLLAFYCIPTRTLKPGEDNLSHLNHSMSSVKTHLNGQGQYSTYAGLLVYIFGRSLGIIIFVSFMPLLLISNLSLSGVEIGLIMASTTLITALVVRPMGMLADCISRKVLICVGGLVVSCLYILIPSACSFTQMYALGVGIGLFSGVAQPACSTLLFEEGVRFGSGFALGFFNTILNLGFVTGSLLGSFLQGYLGSSAPFYAAGCFGIFAVIMFALCADLSASKSN
jgi:MFS family permease